MIKKISVVLLSLSMLLAMAACGGDSGNTSSDATSSNSSSATSEVSSTSEETSSVEELGNTLTDDEIAAIIAEVGKMNEAENHSMTMAMDMNYETTGVAVSMSMEQVAATKGSGDTLESYSNTRMNMFGMDQNEITYYKDGKCYTLTIAGDEVDGYYEEMTADEFATMNETTEEDTEEGALSEFDAIFSEEELKKATVVREDGKKTITCDSESEAIKDMSMSLVEEMGYAADSDAATVNKLEVSFVVGEDGAMEELTLAIDCELTVEEDGMSMDMVMNIVATVKDIAYGEADSIEITAPEGLEDLPSFEDYMNGLLGEDWNEDIWYEDDTV